MKRITFIAAVCLFALTSADRVLAQSLGNAGTVVGTVTDASNSALPKATITILNRITNYRQTVATDSSGVFRFSNVPPNPYRLEIGRAHV